VQFGGEELRQFVRHFGHQQAVQAGEGELVVEEARRLAGEFALPQGFLGEEGLVEMETGGVEGAQQALEFHSAHARRTQRADGVEHHIPGAGAAAFHGGEVFEADRVQLQKHQHGLVRVGQFAAAPERVGKFGGEFGMAPGQCRRELRSQGPIVGGVGKHVDAEAGVFFQHRGEPVSKTVFQRDCRREGRRGWGHVVWLLEPAAPANISE
jgi:hypothetical protein